MKVFLRKRTFILVSLASIAAVIVILGSRPASERRVFKRVVNKDKVRSTVLNEGDTATINPNWGANGEPVYLRNNDIVESNKIFAHASFNVFVSDRMPLNRTLPDYRDKRCNKRLHALSAYPRVSVIIIFMNEILSALLRTIYSVVNRSPPNLLAEIILVDDNSDAEDMHGRLQKFIRKTFRKGLVKILRHTRRSGLIQARLTGAKAAKGDVLVFLDSHCEATEGWLPPLLEPIMENRKRVVAPIIDIIDEHTFQYRAFSALHLNLGGFSWDGSFTWHPMPSKWRKLGSSLTDPVKTPTIAGGLFAIQRFCQRCRLLLVVGLVVVVLVI